MVDSYDKKNYYKYEINKNEEMLYRVYGSDDYFTRTDDYKQYDLEINIYDNFDSEEPILVTLNKNGAMEEYVITVLSEPLNPDLAYQLTHPEEQNTDPVLPVEDDEPNDDPDDV